MTPIGLVLAVAIAFVAAKNFPAPAESVPIQEKPASKNGEMTEEEEIAALKKILDDPVLRKRMVDRTPSLQRVEWVDKQGNKRSVEDTDRGPHDQKSVVEELTLNGANIEYDDGKVVSVGLEHTTLNSPKREVDAGLVLLKHLPELRRVILYNSTVTDAGLEHLSGLSKLKHLNLGYTLTTDDGLKHLANLTQLELLSLQSTQITNDGLVHLRGMTKLSLLDLSVGSITDAGFDHLKELKGLRKLQVSFGMAPDDVERLRKKLPDCEILK